MNGSAFTSTKWPSSTARKNDLGSNDIRFITPLVVALGKPDDLDRPISRAVSVASTPRHDQRRRRRLLAPAKRSMDAGAPRGDAHRTIPPYASRRSRVHTRLAERVGLCRDGKCVRLERSHVAGGGAGRHRALASPPATPCGRQRSSAGYGNSAADFDRGLDSLAGSAASGDASAGCIVCMATPRVRPGRVTVFAIVCDARSVDGALGKFPWRVPRGGGFDRDVSGRQPDRVDAIDWGNASAIWPQSEGSPVPRRGLHGCDSRQSQWLEIG